MIIKIGGVRGVGKTTLIQSCVNILTSRGYHAERLYPKERMEAVLGVGSNQLDFCSKDDIFVARQVVYRLLCEEANQTPIMWLQDSHFAFVDEGDGITSIDPLSTDRSILGGILLVNASARTVVQRRMADSARRPDRNVLNELQVAKELWCEYKTAYTQATQLNIPFRIIDNDEDGRIRENAVYMARLITTDILWRDPEMFNSRNCEYNSRHPER